MLFCLSGRSGTGPLLQRRLQGMAVGGERPLLRGGAGRTTIRAALCHDSQPAMQTTAPQRCQNITWQEGAVSRESKERLLSQRGCVLWFTGLSGSGKSTVACTLEHALAQRGILTTLLDGDNVRHGLNSNLGFCEADREENIRRIGEVSKLMVESGIVTLASFISPYRRDRMRVRERLGCGDFIEVYMKVSSKLPRQSFFTMAYKK